MTSHPLPRLVRGVTALLGIATVLVAVPALLLAIGAGPLPGVLRSPSRLLTALSSPDDGTLLLALLQVGAWLCWAVLSVALVVEIAARVRGLPAPALPVLGLPQSVATGLVGAAVALFVAAPGAAASPAAPSAVVSAAPTSPSASATASGTAEADEQPVSWSAPAVPGPSVPEGSAQDVAAHRPAGPEPAAAATFRHRVAPHETLWRLAETHLGDGTRFVEIARLNYGRPQPDGRTLTDSHWITPGWELLVPDERPAQTGDGDTDHPRTRHTVRPGESLWSIAADHLGDGRRWPELLAASRDLPQPDGGSITAADLLRPGWQVALPVTEAIPATTPEAGPSGTAPAARDSSPAPAPAQRDGPVEAAHPVADGHTTTDGHATDGHATDGHEDPSPDDGAHDLEEGLPWQLHTTGGVGALLAAGVIGTLDLRRRSQLLQRAPGDTVPQAPAEALAAESGLRAVADPSGVAGLDLVLRDLARSRRRRGERMPALRMARLGATDLELYLDAPTQLPEPWRPAQHVPHGLVWTVALADLPGLDDHELAGVPAPYPALVTVGHDETSHLLVDLERLGTLDLCGPDHLVRSTLAAMAVELATSQWADDVQVTLVGEFAALEDTLRTGRLRYLPGLEQALDELALRCRDDETALAAAGADDGPTARVCGGAPGSWTPEILLVAGTPTAEQAQRLSVLAGRSPRAGWAAVTLGSGEGRWTLRTTDPHDARLEPMDLRLRPQLLDDETRGLIQLLFALAGQPPSPPSRPGPGAAPAGETTDTVGQPARDGGSEQAPGPGRPAPHPASGGPPDPDVAPVVRLLGPVQVDGARGPVEPTKRGRLTELVAFLALFPGAGPHQVDEAIWPGRRHEDNLNTRNTATSKARSWLGRADDGADFLPRHAAGAGYTVSDAVRTDWAWWCALVGDSPATASTSALEEAMRLVRGRPFDGAHPRRYAWADALRQVMTRQIVDVAHELADRNLRSGRWAAAESAAAAGLLVEPAWEPLWRLRITAALDSGNRAAVDEAVARMLALTEALDSDLDRETLDLLDRVRTRRSRAATAS